MSAALPYFAFYPADYLSSATVCRLSLEEQGAYIRLLAHSWQMNGVPADRRELALLLGLEPGGEGVERVLTRVLGLAWKADDNDPHILRNDRQEKERANALRMYAARVERTAKARAMNPKNRDHNANSNSSSPAISHRPSNSANSLSDSGSDSGSQEKKGYPALTVVAALNQGMAENAAIGSTFHPVIAASATQAVADLLAEGIPVAFQADAARAIAASYKPGKRGKQISTFGYCVAAIRQRWAERAAAPGATPSPDFLKEAT